MTSGRILALTIIGVTLIFGAVLWYFVVYAYYQDLEDVAVSVQRPDGTLIDLPLDAATAQGIDAASSPLRFRACFEVSTDTLDTVTVEAMGYDAPTPLIAPGWFECFDAETLGPDLETGAAQAFLGQRDILRGVDRVVAIYPDGRAFAWHQLNGSLE